MSKPNESVSKIEGDKAKNFQGSNPRCIKSGSSPTPLLAVEYFEKGVKEGVTFRFQHALLNEDVLEVLDYVNVKTNTSNSF